MKKVSISLIILLISGYITAGCGKKQEIIARIDNKVITVRDFEKRIKVLPARYQEVIKENKRRFLDEIIVDELLYGEALRQNLYDDRDVKEVIEEAKKKILIARLLKDKVDDAVKVGEEEILDYYNNHKEEFKTPEILRASHILVKTEEEAKGIILELTNGRNFEDLARSRSTDPTSSRGGDIGYFVRGQLDPDFENVCFQMSEGQISDMVKTRFGYHIIKLTERKAPSIENFDEVRGRIAERLIKLLRKKQFNELVERLKERAKIEVNEEIPIFAEDKEKKL